MRVKRVDLRDKIPLFLGACQEKAMMMPADQPGVMRLQQAGEFLRHARLVTEQINGLAEFMQPGEHIPHEVRRRVCDGAAFGSPWSTASR